MIYNSILPHECFPGTELKTVGAFVTHFISARNVLPDDPYNPERCRQILVDYKFSAHYLIHRDGAVWRLVPEALVAWHAGVSEWRGHSGLNEWSIGVELIGDADTPFTDAQYASLGYLAAKAVAKHELEVADPRKGLGDLPGHEHIAPGRKRDPGPQFDWDRFLYPLSSIVKDGSAT